MKKKWVTSVALAGGITIFSMPFVALNASAQEYVNPATPQLLQLRSGDIAIPKLEAPTGAPQFPQPGSGGIAIPGFEVPTGTPQLPQPGSGGISIPGFEVPTGTPQLPQPGSGGISIPGFEVPMEAPQLLQLGSGGIAVPGFEAPKDGIISGSAGCVPDIHEYHKDNQHEHVVFSVGLSSPFLNQDQVYSLLDNGTVIVYAQIYSGDTKLLEFPLFQHPTPDPNTGKKFLVTCLFINEPETNLPTGDYTYKFIAKSKDTVKKGTSSPTIVASWMPENHTFTIINTPTPK